MYNYVIHVIMSTVNGNYWLVPRNPRVCMGMPLVTQLTFCLVLHICS